MLAMPAGAALPQPLLCAAERCAMGNCRRRGGATSRIDAERRLDDLVRAAAAEPPDENDLTAAILDRLGSAGLLPERPPVSIACAPSAATAHPDRSARPDGCRGIRS